MKALILVGGFGTRLRPLTLTKPKPMVEFANKAMVQRQMERLAAAGVNHVILAVSYQSEVMETFLKPLEKELNIQITISVEDEPLGTAGPLALARDHLTADDSPFFVLNSDVICEYPFQDLLKYHNNHGKTGTIFVTKVEDPSKYGVVCTKDDGAIYQFVEKPSTYVSNRINAGIYIFKPDILKLIKPEPTSIEKEIFPLLAHDQELYAYDLEGFWMDVGQPPDFLTGQGMYLDSLAAHGGSQGADTLATGDNIKGNVLIDPSAKIGKGCLIGPHVVIGPNVTIADGVRLSRCCIMKNSKIGANSRINNTIVGWTCRIGKWCLLDNTSVLGEDVTLKDEIFVTNVKVLPHKTLSANILEPGKIVM